MTHAFYHDHQALSILNEEFHSPSLASGKRNGKPQQHRPIAVLMVDELDFLVTPNQSILYNIFEWPSLPDSRLIVLGLANTMNLPDQLLPRIVSRIGLERLEFRAYTE